jgi:sec-independent protein translocase protein TatC
MNTPEVKDPPDEGMTFWEHLEELRSRIIKMFVAALLGTGGAWFLREKILAWLVVPFNDAWKELPLTDQPELNFPDPAGLFFAYLRLSMIAGVVMALPLIFYQLWSFVAPGLYSREKRYAIPFVLSSTVLFAAGAYFGMTFAFPAAFHYLLSFAGPVEGLKIKPTIMVDEYIAFISRMLLAFGAVFELPVLAFFLSLAGIITYVHLLRFFRYFIVVAFLIAAVVTPPDVVSQLMLAIPLIALYGVSIGVAFLFGKKPAKEEASSET